MTSLAAFYPWVLPDVEGAPTPLVDRALRDAADVFLRESLLWTTEQTQDTGAGTSTYTLTVPGGARAVSLKLITYDGGAPLAPRSEAQLDLESPRYTEREHTSELVPYSWRSATGAPKFFFQPTPESVRVVPTPTGAAPLYTQLALTLLPSAKTVEDWVYTDWRRTIAAGALFHLKLMSGQPWSDRKEAAYQKEWFDAGVNEARGRQVRNYARIDKGVRRTKVYY